MIRAVLTGLLLAATGSAASAEDGWSFAVSPYVWLPGISTTTQIANRTLDADLSASDAISNLDFAFMGAAEARNGKWGLILDTIYSDISIDKDTPFGRLWSKAELDTKLSATTLYAAYRLVDTAKGSVDLLGGARFYDLDMTVSLVPGRRGPESRSLGDSWTDPVFGLRGRYLFNEKWFAAGIADAGGFSSDASSYQLFGSLGYQFDARWSAQAGWRYLDVERDIDGDDLALNLSGPLIGLTFRF